ncbi:methylesterase 10-like [Cornus florida]|uniref:methylesterase 10-like n=1 Tax=Cornus florida TaxID=4283 RepID=UPI00289F564C|nr:methylesterase 10-like [Cornus florida]
MESEKHFVLVHGMCHGAWSWYKVVTLLKLAGHRVTALDLGASGVNSKRNDEIASISDYLQPLMDFMASLPHDEKVVLVGHSFGGFVISLAMESFPSNILLAVYVTAFMPNYTSPPATLVQEFFSRTPMESLSGLQFSFDHGQENPATSAIFGPDYMSSFLYQHCQSEDLELAKMLVRPSGLFKEDLGKESLLTEEKFGSVNRVFVVCGEDQLLKEEFQRWMIQNSPAKEVKLIAEAGHMVMLSKPKELCLCIQEIAEKYSVSVSSA